ncbi:MAG: beta-N-acetylglucosaminidase domain-containing protein [Candidatus Marinimicrobia bacterium]|nr:beta-N-acetylglucosaminidase domain-containing protein [Candidatus Neomarinimicrobiota bacterium]
MLKSEFICGTLEGFYGHPWTTVQRLQLFTWMHDWDGMNTYMYAPKDDLYHRSKWRDLYPDGELLDLKNLIQSCHEKGLKFIYAIAPGLDISYSSEDDSSILIKKIEQMQLLGCLHFAILFDDIQTELSIEDQRVFSSFSQAQANVTNHLFDALKISNYDSSLIFCPTVYCERMADYNVTGNDYLNEIGKLLNEEIGFFWTGPEVVSTEISVESIQELRKVIKRKPIIWDNIHANDYDVRQIFFGPYAGRPLELKYEVSGILSNPNCQFWANFNPLRSLAMYNNETVSWNPRQAFMDSTREWLKYFGNDTVTEDEIVLLGDCFYLPGEMGDNGNRLVESVEKITNNEPNEWEKYLDNFIQFKSMLNSLCMKLIATTNRDLLYDYFHPLWELREEAEYISRWIDWKMSGKNKFKSPEFVPKRQGILYKIQKIVHSD